MATTYLGTTVPVYNNSGGQITTAAPLLYVSGYDATAGIDAVTVALAIATDRARRADLVAATTIANNALGAARKEFILENQNTAGLVQGQPIYLSPTVAGTWTATKPTVVNDVQEIGAVLTVHATAGRVLISAHGTQGFAPNDFDSDRLTDKMMRYSGESGTGWVYIRGAVSDGDRIVVNARVYEFDTAVPPGVIGAGADVRIGVSPGEGGTGAANATAQAVAAINADASRVVDAIALGGNQFALIALAAGTGGNYTLTNPVDAGGIIDVSAANLAGGTAVAVRTQLTKAHTLTAADVAMLAGVLGTNEVVIAGFPSTSTPVIVAATARSSAGVPVSLVNARIRVVQANTNFWVALYREPAAGALLAAGDFIMLSLLA